MTPPTEKQTRFFWFALTGLAVATVIGLIVGAVWGLGQVLTLLSPALWPLAIAAVLACLLSPLVDFFERKKIPRRRAILLVFIVAFALIFAVLASVIPQVVAETRQLAAKVPEYSQKLQTRAAELMAHPPEFIRNYLPKPAPGAVLVAVVVADTNAPATITALPKPETTTPTAPSSWLSGSLPEIGSWLWRRVATVASGFGLLAGLVLIPVYAFYFLLEQRSIENHWKEYLPLQDSRAKEEVVFVIEAIQQYLVAFFRGQVFVALCVAVLYTLGFLIVGVNYAFLLGFAAIFLTMIPFLGAILVCLTALLLAFAQYGDWQHPALVLVVFAIVQGLEGLFISPKIMGDRVGLHPLAIIIAVMAGTTLFGGILGGLLAIPLAAALRVMMFRYVWKKRPPEPVIS